MNKIPDPSKDVPVGVNQQDLSIRLAHIRSALACEASAILAASERLDDSILKAVDMLFECDGKVVVTGMGKMGWIARKAASTFCSTGAPSIFLHPGEAVHGDLGLVTTNDVLVVLSNSGETDEILRLLPFMRRFDIPVIALTGSLDSRLAKHSDILIDTSVTTEADPISVAPTSSTTVALAMCDALAVTLMHQRGFTREQFAIFHPGGHLGRKLLLAVKDLMHKGGDIPTIGEDTLLREAIVSISQKGLGAALILDKSNGLVGIITDGDLRRALQSNANPLENRVTQHMIKAPKTIGVDSLAAEALRLMEDCEITVLPVVDANDHVQGIIHLHDLIRVGLA